MSRRWLQFSLRGFLLLMTVFAVWLGLVAEKAMRRKEAVALLEGWGASIDYGYDWQGPLKPPKPKASPHGWPWLRKLLGRHFFDKVVNVELVAGDRRFTAAETALAISGRAPAPPRLLVLTDAEFTALGYLPHLRRLLIVGDFDATPAGLRGLGRLSQLETLIFDNTSGRSTGGVTDESFVFIERLPRLTTLYLEGGQITDGGIANIRWPPGLLELDLSGTRITDAGLIHLQKIATLRRLVVLDCRVTDSGVANFQQARPNCTIAWRGW